MGILNMGADVVVGGIWKVAAIGLAGLLVVGAAGGGTALWLASSTRDKAEAALITERGVSASLRASIAIQNSAVDAMALSVRAADERRDVAERYAATAIKATGAREAAARSSAATTCDGVLREAWGHR